MFGTLAVLEMGRSGLLPRTAIGGSVVQRSIEGMLGLFVIPTVVSPWRKRAYLSFSAGSALCGVDTALWILSAKLNLPFETLSGLLSRGIYLGSFLSITLLFGFGALSAFNALTEPPTRGPKHRLHTAALVMGPLVAGSFLCAAGAVGTVFAVAN